ncbi:T9SS type A sorting domain-containing protein [bacterium]|nr:T9SS type A sorting domain-containing protein [bacterium]
MKKKFVGIQVLVFLLAFVFVTGVALADDRSSPVVNTDASWPFTFGEDGEADAAVYGRVIGADDYDFAGQTVSSSQRVPVLFSLVPSTGTVNETNFSGGAASNFDTYAAVFPLASGNYAWIGRKEVSAGVESRGSIFVRTSSGGHVTYNHTFGSASTLTRFNAGMQISGGTYDGSIVAAGFSTQSGNAGAGDIRLQRTNASDPLASQAAGFLGGVNAEEAFAVIQLSSTLGAVAGYQDDGAGDHAFYVAPFNFSDMTLSATWTLGSITADGDDDVIRDMILDGNGDLIIVGTAGTSGSTTGFVAKVDTADGSVDYEWTTTATDIEFYDADLMSDGDIVITGRSGEDLYLIEVQDSGTEFTQDWANTYDSSADGDIGYWVEEQADNSIVVTGVADDASSTNAVFWLFDQPALTVYPAAISYTSPADAATQQDTAGVTLTWANGGTGGGEDATTNVDIYFDENATPTALVVDDDAITTTTYATGSLDPGTTYYWYAVARDADGDETEGAVQSFTTLNPPNTPSLTSPADAAVDQDSTDVTIQWADGSGTGDAAATYDLFFDTNATPTTKVVDDAAQTSYSTGAITGGATYYWYVVARDADGDVTSSAIRSFTVQEPANVVYVSIDSDVASTYYDNDNIAGFHELADDAYDDYDTPEPPAFGAGYIRTYISESGFSSPFDQLTEDYRDWTGKTFGTTPYLFDITTVTDQDGLVSYTVDVTNGNGNDWPVAWWDGADFQNMNGASDEDNTFSYTADATGGGGTDTDNYAILIGDTTAPVVTEVFPVSGGTSEIQRNDANATLEVSFDDTAPIRQVLVYFSPSDDSNSPRENWTELTNSPMTYDGSTNGSPDDPTDGVTNANLTLPWVPYVDDNALFSSPSDLFPAAQMRFISEDWMGNKDTTYVDFAITPDEFDYTGDFGAGWHLISVPMDPDEDLADDMFTTATGDDNGIAGDFTAFEYSASGGYEQPTVMAIAKGYWLVLDSDNTAAAVNAGLGTILGTIAGASENVDLSLDVDSYNLVGVTVRTEDLSGGGAIQAEEWVFSDDAWTSTYTWTEATTSADKGGDTGVWIDATSLVSYDNSGGDYTAQIAASADLDPGVGYTLSVGTVGTGVLQMRTVRTDVEGDIVDPGDNGNHDLDELDDFNGEWFIPIRTAIGDYFNEQSGFGCNLEASEGWDPGLDATNPPLPPSGHYVRAVVDGQACNAPFGRYFVTDIRAPFEPGVTESSWTFKVYSSEHGTIAMTFDISSLEEYNVPEGFTATATVNGETFDLLSNQTITFDYDGGMVPVVIEAALTSTSVGEGSDLPTEYSIASAYPNPFNPSTVIRVGLPAAANMDVAVYNVLGKQVASLASGTYNAGYHNLVFDAHSMASGVYFIRASVPGKLNQVKKVVLVR